MITAERIEEIIKTNQFNEYYKATTYYFKICPRCGNKLEEKRLPFLLWWIVGLFTRKAGKWICKKCGFFYWERFSTADNKDYNLPLEFNRGKNHETI